jgi:hypothetical protein
LKISLVLSIHTFANKLVHFILNNHSNKNKNEHFTEAFMYDKILQTRIEAFKIIKMLYINNFVKDHQST